MSKAELIKRLDDEHHRTLMLVQGFSQEDFDRKAPASDWTAKDLFAHLALWNRETLNAIEVGLSQEACRGVAADPASRSLGKVMEEFRNSQRAIVAHVRSSKVTDAGKTSLYVNSVIGHYQSHQNELGVLINSLRPH